MCAAVPLQLYKKPAKARGDIESICAPCALSRGDDRRSTGEHGTMSKTRANPGGGIRILGMGKCLPARCVTNEDLTEYVDTSDAWIRERTGIRTRYYSTTETHLDLAATAAQRALERTGIRPDQIGLCIVATISADYATPSAACLVQERLGLPHWYGRNLDALYDCLTDLREVTVYLRNPEAMTGALGDYGDKVLRVFRDAAAENPGFGFDVI